MSEAPRVPVNGNGDHQTSTDRQQEPAQQQSILTRSWHAIFSPFSPSALATLPNLQRPARYLRLDDIPETATDGEGQQPTVRDYHAINSVPPQVRVPKKIPTSIKVESKVWFANERSEFLCFCSLNRLWMFDLFSAWVSWLNISVLLAALALGLFNASKDDIARRMAYVYAVISMCVLVRSSSHLVFQHLIVSISRSMATPYTNIASLWFAVVIRVILVFTPFLPIHGTQRDCFNVPQTLSRVPSYSVLSSSLPSLRISFSGVCTFLPFLVICFRSQTTFVHFKLIIRPFLEYFRLTVPVREM